jgi:hypothetical protein
MSPLYVNAISLPLGEIITSLIHKGVTAVADMANAAAAATSISFCFIWIYWFIGLLFHYFANLMYLFPLSKLSACSGY